MAFSVLKKVLFKTVQNRNLLSKRARNSGPGHFGWYFPPPCVIWKHYRAPLSVAFEFNLFK